MPRIKNPDLVLTTIRLNKAAIKQARKDAKRQRTGYQQVIRQWVDEKAADAVRIARAANTADAPTDSKE